MSMAQRVQWPTVFSGLRGIAWANLPSEISAGLNLCEALLLVRSCSRKHSTKADGDRVLFAYGMASVASGFTGSLISGPSASRTAAFCKETGQAPPESRMEDRARRNL